MRAATADRKRMPQICPNIERLLQTHIYGSDGTIGALFFLRVAGVTLRLIVHYYKDLYVKKSYLKINRAKVQIGRLRINTLEQI